MAEPCPRLLLLLALAVALPATLRWLAEDAEEPPTLAVVSAPSVSTSPKLVRVPNVAGFTPGGGLRVEYARAELKRLGFRIREIEIPDSDVHVVGVVLRQEPEPNQRAPAGSQVTLYVGG